MPRCSGNVDARQPQTIESKEIMTAYAKQTQAYPNRHCTKAGNTAERPSVGVTQQPPNHYHRMSISAQAISGCSREARLIRIQAAWRRAVSCRALAAANYSCYLPSSPNVTGADQHYHRRHRDAWMLDRQAAAAPESAGSGRSALECLGPDSTSESEVRRAGPRRRLAGWTLSNGALAACGCRRRCCAA